MPSTRKQQIADLVRAARDRKGWTQAELAERVGVNLQTIGHIERALHKPREALMERLADALEADLSAEAQAGHAMIDEIAAKLSEKMRDYGPVDGLRCAADVLEVVENWKPRRRGGVPVDGSSPKAAKG